MTVEERLEALDKKLKADTKKKEAEKRKKEEEIEALLAKVYELRPRIQNLTIIMSKCYEVGITKAEFIAERRNHALGFMENGKTIGYYGVFEEWDFYTDGYKAVETKENEYKVEKRTPTEGYLRTFLHDFQYFEEQFYKWFDNMVSSTD